MYCIALYCAVLQNSTDKLKAIIAPDSGPVFRNEMCANREPAKSEYNEAVTGMCILMNHGA